MLRTACLSGTRASAWPRLEQVLRQAAVRLSEHARELELDGFEVDVLGAAGAAQSGEHPARLLRVGSDLSPDLRGAARHHQVARVHRDLGGATGDARVAGAAGEVQVELGRQADLAARAGDLREQEVIERTRGELLRGQAALGGVAAGRRRDAAGAEREGQAEGAGEAGELGFHGRHSGNFGRLRQGRSAADRLAPAGRRGSFECSATIRFMPW